MSNLELQRYMRKPYLQDMFKNIKLKSTKKKCYQIDWNNEDNCYLDPIMYDCITKKNSKMTPSNRCYTDYTIDGLFNVGKEDSKGIAIDPFTRQEFTYKELKKLLKKSLQL